MSTVNVPEVFILDDTDKQTVVKITGFYNTATTQNTQVVTANTLKGASNTLPCILSIGAMEYSTSIANGFIALEFIGSGSANSNALLAGRANDGAWNRYIPNSGAAPTTGNLNLFQSGLGAGDSFSIIVTLIKEFQGTYWTGTNYGAGAWTAAETGY